MVLKRSPFLFYFELTSGGKTGRILLAVQDEPLTRRIARKHRTPKKKRSLNDMFLNKETKNYGVVS